MGTEVGIEPHCDWNTTKEDERDVSIHPGCVFVCVCVYSFHHTVFHRVLLHLIG